VIFERTDHQKRNFESGRVRVLGIQSPNPSPEGSSVSLSPTKSGLESDITDSYMDHYNHRVCNCLSWVLRACFAPFDVAVKNGSVRCCGRECFAPFDVVVKNGSVRCYGPWMLRSIPHVTVSNGFVPCSGPCWPCSWHWQRDLVIAQCWPLMCQLEKWVSLLVAPWPCRLFFLSLFWFSFYIVNQSQFSLWLWSFDNGTNSTEHVFWGNINHYLLSSAWVVNKTYLLSW